MRADPERLILKKYKKYCEYPTLSEAQLLSGIENSIFSLHQLELEGKRLEEEKEKKKKEEKLSLQRIFQTLTPPTFTDTDRQRDRDSNLQDANRYIIIDDIHNTGEGTSSPWYAIESTATEFVSYPHWTRPEPRGPHHYHKYLSYIREQEIENPEEIRRIKYEEERFRINIRSMPIHCRIRDPTTIFNVLS